MSFSLKNNIKQLLVFLSLCMPRIKCDVIYTNVMNRSNDSGPKRFLHNLEGALKDRKLHLSSFSPMFASAALIIINSPGNYFFHICKRRNVKTVLRVDGFFSPEVFLNNGVRNMTMEKISVNQRMQKDLLLSDWVIYQSEFSKSMADKYLFNRKDNYSIIHMLRYPFS